MQDADSRLAHWKACDPAHLLWKSWGDMHVAYHRPSGKTHFLNDASHMLLVDVLAAPQTIDTIARAVIGERHDSALQNELLATLERFEALGLAERA